jgi:hypothetical protein
LEFTLPVPEEVFDVRLEPIRELTGEVTSLLDLAIARSRAHAFADEEVKELISGALEAAKQEITHLEELVEESSRETPRQQRGRSQEKTL